MSTDVGRNIGAQVIANVEKTLRAEGREQGLVAGRLEQAARALLAVFEARHMTIPDSGKLGTRTNFRLSRTHRL